MALVVAAVALFAWRARPAEESEPRYEHDGRPAVQLVVSPHPDDEMQAINALDDDPRLFTVFVLSTRGENTSVCNTYGRAWSRIRPEFRPDPAPAGRGTGSCARARLDSWHLFLDLLAGISDIPLDTREEMRGVTVPGVHDARIGRASARFVFDTPNGELGAADVRRHLDTVLRERGRSMPDLPLEKVVAAAYYNEDRNLGAVYPHDEHQVVQEVLRERSTGARNGHWIPVPPRARDIDVSRESTLQEYDRLMGFTRRGKPVGAHQRAYRWLVFGGVRGNWAPSRDAVHHRSRAYIWPRRQHFEVVHARGD